MQQGDYSSFYGQNPTVNPADHHTSSYASAPPFSGGYAPADYSSYSQNLPPYHLNPDPAPPTAPSYTPTSPSPNLLQPHQPQPVSFHTSPQPPVQYFPPYDSHGAYQPPTTQQSYYPPYDHHQTAPNYAPPPTAVSSNTNPNPSAIPPYSSMYSAPYSSVASSIPSVYDNSYENPGKFDQGGGYTDNKYGGFSRSRSDLGSDLYGKRPEIDGHSRYDLGREDAPGDGVYAYQGGKTEPYGARGTDSKSSTWTMFDDYGRSISVPSVKENSTTSGFSKIVKAVPKADTQQDVKSGVQKFRVKLLTESVGQSTMDVLCQIGLDGIRMLDPATNRTLRIYPLETITRCEVMDSSTLAFWSKSSVDIDPRRIRLQSNSYTTNTLLDIVTAATVQVKEMVGRSRPPDSSKTTEQPTDKKKGFGDWMNLIKPPNEEKDHWVPDEAVSKCTACGTDFGAFVRRHHCRNCGDIFCDKCTHGRIALTADENAQPVRVCDRCMAEVTQRLSNAKDAANRPAVQSHEDLARKLQEEMEKNRKASSGSKADGSGRRMREVACPICTVHLQVQVPSSGSETIECGVCQHPFLVSAH
ncbi:COPII coat assembly protein SEC16 isoform X1 [Tripterygium wilfordii]|uniref:COPII coat assembly protein SEC16 isoform X1 n=1 Tax=Tripterygium wilfordii TaxID=458696 RepID=A0A7J7DLP5_TRIWF|nr:protein FREE1-like [Tripterygium wilfordii]KAF5747189.1 COPII coat assembly protein SEC16 isoform X1 [Tripterygium wilfordii]